MMASGFGGVFVKFISRNLKTIDMQEDNHCVNHFRKTATDYNLLLKSMISDTSVQRNMARQNLAKNITTNSHKFCLCWHKYQSRKSCNSLWVSQFLSFPVSTVLLSGDPWIRNIWKSGPREKNIAGIRDCVTKFGWNQGPNGKNWL